MNLQIGYIKWEKKVIYYLKSIMHLNLIYNNHLNDKIKLKH